MSTIKLGEIKCVEDVRIPGAGEKRGLITRRLPGDSPADNEMYLDDVTGLVTITYIARPGVAPVIVHVSNIRYMEALLEPAIVVPVAPVAPVEVPTAPETPQAKAAQAVLAAAKGKAGKIVVGEEE